MKIKLSDIERKWLKEYFTGMEKYVKGDRNYNRTRDRILSKMEVASEEVSLTRPQYDFTCNFVKSIVTLADTQLSRLRKPAWYEFWKVSRNTRIEAVRKSLTRSKAQAQQILKSLGYEEPTTETKQTAKKADKRK